MGILQVPVNAGVPRARAAKDTRIPFPCQDKACGCLSAEQCFASCCCFSVAERRKFASERGIKAAIPEGATAAGCCVTKGGEPPTCSDALPAADSRVPSWSAYLICRGIAPAWTLFSAVTFFAAADMSLAVPAPGEFVALGDMFPIPQHFVPETPPPRFR